MNNIYRWWQAFGPFEDEDEGGQYPAPGRVIEHYRNKQRWTQADVAKHLHIETKMVRAMERHSTGLDSIVRRRRLCKLLEIPFLLLGLDSPPQPEIAAQWWKEAGYPDFISGPDGYPQAGPVVKYYRRQMRLSGRRKSWTQMDLGEALGISDLAVRRLENKADGLDSIARRRQLAFILHIPPALLGLDGRQTPISTARYMPHYVPLVVSFAPDADLLSAYQELQRQNLADPHPNQELANQRVAWIMHLQQLLAFVHPEHQRVVMEMEYHYNNGQINYLLACHRDWQAILGHLERNLFLAHELDTLSSPSEPLYDFTTDALCQQTLIYIRKGDNAAALQAGDSARAHAPQANKEREIRALTLAGLAVAQAATSQRDKKLALQLLDQAAHQLHFQSPQTDQHTSRSKEQTQANSHIDPQVNLVSSQYHMDRTEALLNMGMAESALREIRLAEHATPRYLEGRMATLSIFRAYASMQMKEYGAAVEEVIKALPVSLRLKYLQDVARVAKLYRALRTSSYGDRPRLAHLAWLLGPWIGLDW